jgi:hypothetical protein
MDVGGVGLVRSINGVDGVKHRHVNQSHVAGQGDRGWRARQALHQDLIPVEDDVAGHQAAGFQLLGAEQGSLHESHSEISFGLR